MNYSFWKISAATTSCISHSHSYSRYSSRSYRYRAVHVAIRIDVAVEIGGIAVDVRRVNIAAPLIQDVPHGK